MAGVDEQELAVARVYAGSMLQLAHTRGEADRLQNELLDLAGRVEKDAVPPHLIHSFRYAVQNVKDSS